MPCPMLVWSLLCLLTTTVATRDSFNEVLTLNPLPDGKLSVLFEFTTYFGHSGQHHALTPPALLLPLEHNNVSELTVSFVAGQWDQTRAGEAGPLQYEAGGGGGEVRGWLRGDDNGKQRWTAVNHALGGLFCAGLGEAGDVATFGHIYPPLRPNAGLSGLSTLLAQPGIVFSWGYKTEGIEVIMPDGDLPGRWTGWWEGVVDLVPERGGNRAFSLGSLFRRGVPKPFPEADSSVLRLVKNQGMSVEPASTIDAMVDQREAYEWDLLDPALQHKDIRATWDTAFAFPLVMTPPPVTIHRTIMAPYASDGIFAITIRNSGEDRMATYSEVWPWWVKGWMSEMSVTVDGREHPIQDMQYHPSLPPTESTTSIHLRLLLPAGSTILIKIPFTKLTLKYTEHRPDAERGRDIASGILTLDKANTTAGDANRPRIYTNRLLLDVPTPDFSMPYNVIIMSSTVMAVFFGLMHGSLTRRWGWVEVDDGRAKAGLGKN